MEKETNDSNNRIGKLQVTLLIVPIILGRFRICSLQFSGASGQPRSFF